MTARDRYNADATKALTDWHMFCIPPRASMAGAAIFREGFAEIVALRLRIAYMPLFETLERIEARVAVLADMKREPWVHPDHPANRRL